MKENLKTLSLVVIALSVFTMAMIDVLKLTIPREENSASNFKENNNSKIGDAMKGNSSVKEIPMDTTQLTSIKFEETSHDFGTIHEGDSVSYSFGFVNTGYKPLVITSARGSCGCTIPDYPKGPIGPGNRSIVVVKFKSAGKQGEQLKTVQVISNTNPRMNILEIRAKVLPKK